MVKAHIVMFFCANLLTKEAQAVTSRNDSLAILECTQFNPTANICDPIIEGNEGMRLEGEFTQNTEDLLLQAGAARASSTNTVNTTSTPVSTASPTGGLSYTDLTNTDQDDSQIPALEDIYDNPNDNPISKFQTRSKVNKSSGAYAFISLWEEKGHLGQNGLTEIRKDEEVSWCINKARIEAIRIFFAFASYIGFIVYQMDVKSAFLYGKIDEEMSSMGELTFFLGLQVKQKEDGIFISQDKYVAEILKKFDFVSVKTASTPIETQKPLVKDEEASDVDVHLYRSMIGSLMYLTASRPDIMFAVCACSRFQVNPKTSHLSAVKRIFRYLKGKPKLGLWYPRVSSFDLEAYSDSDYAGANLDRKSTTGGCQFLGRRLISWQCKKQTIVATSTTEAEYVAAANCCGQVLWIQNQMLDYGFNFMNTKIYIDNESTICIVKNPVYHSKTKHIAIRHHFIRDAYEKKLIQVLKIHTDDNVADLLTKAFDVSRALDGTEALLLPKLFILWLAKVSTDSANLVPLGKDSTAIETLKKIPPRSFMRLLTFLCEAPFTMLSLYITANVAGKPVSISKASIRSDLLIDDADGIDSLPNQAIFDAIQLMGDLTILTFNKFYMDTENAQDMGRSRFEVNVEKEREEKEVSTEDVEEVSTDRPDEGTDDQAEGRSATPTTQTPTPTTFGDDETIAQVLLNMSQAKAKFKQLARDEEMARKMQEDWETEEERKRLAEEEATNAALIQDFDDIKARMEADRLLALRLQEEEREQFTMKERAKFLHDTIAAQRSFTADVPLEDERKIKEMNEGAKDLEHKRLKKKVAKETPKKEDTAKVRAKVNVTEQGTKKRKGGHIKMLARKRKRPQSDVDSDDKHRKCLKIVTFEEQYSKITLDGIELILWGDLKIMMESSKEENDQSDFWSDQQDWKIAREIVMKACGDSDLGFGVERESTAALDLIIFIKQQINEEWRFNGELEGV
ncbi:hypothetical protein Tco_0693830 [Tanacetum coccineum]